MRFDLRLVRELAHDQRRCGPNAISLGPLQVALGLPGVFDSVLVLELGADHLLEQLGDIGGIHLGNIRLFDLDGQFGERLRPPELDQILGELELGHQLGEMTWINDLDVSVIVLGELSRDFVLENLSFLELAHRNLVLVLLRLRLVRKELERVRLLD